VIVIEIGIDKAFRTRFIGFFKGIGLFRRVVGNTQPKTSDFAFPLSPDF
jgi:hypothetical protein